MGGCWIGRLHSQLQFFGRTGLNPQFSNTHRRILRKRHKNSDKKRGNRFLNNTHPNFFSNRNQEQVGQIHSIYHRNPHCPLLTQPLLTAPGRLLDEPQRESGGYTLRPVGFFRYVSFCRGSYFYLGVSPTNSEVIICSFLFPELNLHELQLSVGDTSKLYPFIQAKHNYAMMPVEFLASSTNEIGA